MLRRLTEHNDEGLARLLLLRPRLEAAPRTGASLPCLTVGRHPSNDLVLASTGIPLLMSRYHAAITFDGEQFTVVDRSTTNGTYVRPQPTAGRLAALPRSVRSRSVASCCCWRGSRRCWRRSRRCSWVAAPRPECLTMPLLRR
jgi:hypothetical protein